MIVPHTDVRHVPSDRVRAETSIVWAKLPLARRLAAIAASATALALPATATAYSSGSTGADGALTPTVNTEVVLPTSGVLNYTRVSIPTGVTVTFRKNTTNTPVVLLVSGDVTVAGTISVNGSAAPGSGASGNGQIGDDGLPGEGGPGGYSGGRGGPPGTTATVAGGAGNGPGGGAGGTLGTCTSTPYRYSGAGGGYGVNGESTYTGCSSTTPSTAGQSYGSANLLPLIGGSGGGGGAGGLSFGGSGGGGGGGAILIAASGTLSITGSITANGGSGGTSLGDGCGAVGGGGSGGAIRLVATAISGNGTLSATGAPDTYSSSSCTYSSAGRSGGTGRIRLEAETFTRTTSSSPAHTFGTPGLTFIAGLPTLTITSVGGAAVPASPTGVADVTLPSTTTNPVTVTFATSGVPVGNTVTVKVTPAYGAATSAVSTALTGSTASATAGASVTLPAGASTLQATVTYTIVASLGDVLSRYAHNERVESITLSATAGSATKAVLTTVSGKQYEAPSQALQALQIAAVGG